MSVKIDLRRMRLTPAERMQEDLLEAKTPYAKLLIAATYGNLELATKLLEEGVSLNVDADSFVATPLYVAACSGQLEMVKFLVNKGANVNQPSRPNLNNFPLNIAISQRHFNIFNYLLSQGANVNAKGWDNTTALHAAASLAQYDIKLAEKIIIKLIEKGADVTIKEGTFGKPLEYAVFCVKNNVLIDENEKSKRIEIVTKLLSNPHEKKESKEKEVKEKEIKGINAAQLTLLKSFIGAGVTEEEKNEKGFLIQAIEESKAADLGIKILYLRRSVSQSCHKFLQSLDKLYKAFPDDKEKNEENLTFIKLLKKINDMCFNNDIVQGEYGIKPCLTQDFGRLRSKDVTLDDEASAFKRYVKKMIRENIKLLKKGHKNKVCKQIIARKKAERSISVNLAWRTLVELPQDQQTLRLSQPTISLSSGTPLHSQNRRLVGGSASRFIHLGRSSSGARRGTFFSISDSGGGYRTLSEEQRVENISSLLSTQEAKSSTASPPVSLNGFQSQALSQLGENGLTSAHFIGTDDWFNTFLHVYALSHLMRNRGSDNMTAEAGMNVIQELNYGQLLNIESWQPLSTISLRR